MSKLEFSFAASRILQANQAEFILGSGPRQNVKSIRKHA